MRILHVIFRIITGGTENLIIDIVNRQAAIGHKVTVMVINSGSDPSMLAKFDPAVRIITTERAEGSRSMAKIAEINLRALAFRPDVVHIHNKRVVNLLVAPGLRRRMIHTLHTTGIELSGRQLRTRFTAISHAVADDFRTRYGLDAPVVHNGIIADSVRPRMAPHGAIRSIVSVGRLDAPIKGQDLLIRAMADPRLAGMTLTLMGAGASEAELRALAAGLGVDDRITFAGTVARDDVYGRLADFDLFVLPSRTEGFGLALAEAMAAGIPVVTADLPGPMELITTDGAAPLGLSFTAGSAAALADAIAAAAAMAPDEIADMTRRARSHVDAQFSIHATVDTFIRLYSQLKS
ncbi:MAG: glycosyltransferase [Muribaculaceae bacterium]|nr:glycosyltransferase [Muribaculaceae bacterium]